jgi:hypothetical protein
MPKPTALTIDGTQYDTQISYKDAHNSYWQSAGRRDHDDMPLMQTEAYYAEARVDGMDTMRLDDLIRKYGPLTDADPDLGVRTNEVARSIRTYRDSIRNCPATLSPGRASTLIGRLQAAVETLADQLGLDYDG